MGGYNWVKFQCGVFIPLLLFLFCSSSELVEITTVDVVAAKNLIFSANHRYLDVR